MQEIQCATHLIKKLSGQLAMLSENRFELTDEPSWIRCRMILS